AFLLNSIWDAEETKKRIPDSMKKYLAENEINFYIINATEIAEKIGLGNRINTVMQSSFFKISEVIPYDKALEYMKKHVQKNFGKKGEDIVKMNNEAVDMGGQKIVKIEVPEEWKNIQSSGFSLDKGERPDFIKNVCDVMNAQKGDDLPVSAFLGKEDGTFPAGTTQYEKRGVAVNVPEWISENCIQCNQCAYVCPHAVIRPFLINEEEEKQLPEGTKTIKPIGKDLQDHKFRIQVSVMDCTGCGNCADVCPAPKGKALVMKPFESQKDEVKRWDAIAENVTYKDKLVDKFANVKSSQFAKPLFEFSGACAGCGETPYIKAITQLFGDRMMIANATGCSSIYGGSAPSTPYCANPQGKGPAWANSLFEDNAEYGFGMTLGVNKLRNRLVLRMKDAIDSGSLSAETKEAFLSWIESKDDAEGSKTASEKVRKAIVNDSGKIIDEIKDLDQYLVKKSVWIFGGDGWAYDIGYGGLDHVLASGDDVNVLVMDTEVYSNTGGQSSKATPVGAVAKFAASGKKIRKKDLGMMAMTYGYVYVAQVAMGASQAQYFKAIKEAEAYPGPSLIIAYAPCINHGLRSGMGKSQKEEKLAVESGYWHLYRYNPSLEEEGKNPFTLDSKEPQWDKFQEFLKGEVRYTSLVKTFPEEAKILFDVAEENAKWRYKSYKMKSETKF
ncbi:MAG: pyruvate:ferredoxin (flavodoxin) oxidoreductase, partial [Candidatus Delongbacteria bacterium]